MQQAGVRIRVREEEPLFGSRIFFLVSSILMFASTMAFFHLKKYSETYCKADSEKGIIVRNPNQTTSKRLFVSLMILQAAVNCFQNGILMSVQSYSCVRYGMEAYHWSVNLNQMIGPLVMYISSYFSLTSLWRLTIAFFLLVMCVGYEIATALVNDPAPFVEYSHFGPTHIVSTVVIKS